MTPEESEDAKIAAEAAAPAGAAAAQDSGASVAPSPQRGSDPEAAEAHPSVGARKLAPPPKPARESRPVAPPPVEIAPTPRTPMIVVGEPSQPLQREGAQAWTRPTSEPPRQSTPPWGNVAPRRDPTPSVGVLRSRLEAREKSSPPREWSAVSPIPPKVAPAPAAQPPAESAATAAPLPEKARPAVDALGPAPSARANAAPPTPASPYIATPLPHGIEVTTAPRESTLLAGVVAPAPAANGAERDPAKDAEPDPDAPTPVPLGARAEREPDADTLPRAAATPVSDSGEPARPPSGDGEAPRAASDAGGDAILPPRPKSGPARLRSGPPRPRASSPEFSARPSSTDPPRPAASGTVRGQGGVEVPPPPKMPSFSQGGVAHVTAPAAPEDASERRSEPPVPPSAIAVMKIIAVGDPAEPPIELEGDFEEAEEAAPAPAPVEAAADGADGADGAAPPLPVAAEELEELPVEEVAPDSAERKTPIPELPIEEAIPVVEDLESMETGSAEARAREVDIRPPPPPRRAPKTPSLPKPVPQAKRRQKRAWWEDVFGEDFVRANFKLSEQQIRREVDFIEESLGVAAGGVVLDLGCGAGHHAVELASRGYGVVGYDLSLYQLALAAEVAQERSQRLNFLQGDMREMAFEEMFDGIFSWNTSFGYFEEDKNLLVAERVFRALRPGGMFLIDVVNRDFAAVQSPCSLWFEGEQCVCMDDMSLDFITSRMRVKRSVILDDGRTRECVYSIRVYSMHELGKLLHDVGFRVTEASGHPSTPGVFFGEYSPRIIMLAQKP